jgi:uncharacterized membrane-anchored protein
MTAYLEQRLAPIKCIASALFIIVGPTALSLLATMLKPRPAVNGVLFIYTMVVTAGMIVVWLVYWPSAMKQRNRGHLPVWTGLLAAILVVVLVVVLLAASFVENFSAS